jgi:hypothetical protein
MKADFGGPSPNCGVYRRIKSGDGRYIDSISVRMARVFIALWHLFVTNRAGYEGDGSFSGNRGPEIAYELD